MAILQLVTFILYFDHFLFRVLRSTVSGDEHEQLFSAMAIFLQLLTFNLYLYHSAHSCTELHCVRCVGSVLMISLGLHWRWWQLAALCPLVPLAALALSLIVPESPVFR